MTEVLQPFNDFQDLDPQTALMMLGLQLTDIENLLSSRKGKHRADKIPDHEQAYILQCEEIMAGIASLKDRLLRQSISTAVQDDGVAISLARAEELQATHDNLCARHKQDLRNTNIEAIPSDNLGELGNLSDEVVDRLSSFNLFDGLPDKAKITESDPDSADVVCCSACAGSFPVPQIYRAPCGDAETRTVIPVSDVYFRMRLRTSLCFRHGAVGKSCRCQELGRSLDLG